MVELEFDARKVRGMLAERRISETAFARACRLSRGFVLYNSCVRCTRQTGTKKAGVCATAHMIVPSVHVA